jgi:hypothetical protein
MQPLRRPRGQARVRATAADPGHEAWRGQEELGLEEEVGDGSKKEDERGRE